MACIDRKPDASSVCNGLANAFKLEMAGSIGSGIGVRPGMNLDHRRAGRPRRIKLARFGIDK